MAQRPAKPLSFQIRSNLAASRRVVKRILAEMGRREFHPDGIFAVKLAMEEAIINAIRHGNHSDPARKIRIEAFLGPRRVRIDVEDEGVGFDRRSVPNPTRTENLEKTTGRGIWLIEAYMDKVRWSRGGRRIQMFRRNEPQVIRIAPR